jgi:hypothetical protein
VKDLDELIAELGHTVEQLTDQPDQGFEAMRQSFQWVAVELVELDPVLESLEQIRNVGSCALLALGPLAEGLVESLQAIDSAETRRFASRITNNPYFESGFILGGAVGILADARDLVFKALAAAAGPLVALASLKEALQKALQQLVDLLNELVGPRGAEVARELGRSVGKQLGAKLAELNKPEGPFMFAFGVGKEIGPAIVYTVLSLLGFEAIVAGRLVLLARGGLQSLKSFERLAPLFKRAPDADLPLPDVTPEGRPEPTGPEPTGPEPTGPTPPTLAEIIRADGIVLSSRHRIRIVDGKLVRCTDCSVLARVYDSVLQDPAIDVAVRDALRDRIGKQQAAVDEALAAGFDKNQALELNSDELMKLDNDIQELATGLGRAIAGRPSAKLTELLETRFRDHPEAIRLLLEEESTLLLANRPGFAELLVSDELGAGAREAFFATWLRRYSEPAIRRAVAEVMSGGARGSRLETALRKLEPVSMRDPQAGQAAINAIIAGAGARRTVKLVPNAPWRNQVPNFLTPEEFAALPETGTIAPNRVRFAQKSASPVFDDGKLVQETIDQLSDPNFDPSAIPGIEICEREGRVYTLSTRRVVAAQAAALVRPDLQIPYRKKFELSAADAAKFEQVDGASIHIRKQ